MKVMAQPDPAAPAARQVVEITVADGYHPDVVEAYAGVPIRLIFRRTDAAACSDRVVFSSPRLERRLAPMSTTIIDLPAAFGREIRFTCGMGKYRGRIELVSSRSSAINRARRAWHHIEGDGSGATAALASLVLLLLLLLSSVLILAPALAVLLVGAATVAALAGRAQPSLRPPRQPRRELPDRGD